MVININDNIFSIGSCFALEINRYLKRNGIDSLVNPFGTIYNSYSIYKNIETIVLSKDDGLFEESEITEIDGKFVSFNSSTLFESDIYQNLKNKLINSASNSKEKLLKSNIVIITFGTSVVYRLKESGKIVANCHKLNEALFTKEMLSVEENIEFITKTISLLKEHIPNIKIILTLSPVRHNINNPEENSLSKAILRVAIDSLINNRDIFYFSAYELVIDGFRDYSYYKKDKTHLKKRTVLKIMEEFSSRYFNDELKKYISNFEKLKKNRKHKPFNPEDEKYFNHLKNTLLSLYKMYEIRESSVIEKEIFFVGEKLFNYFVDRYEELINIFNQLKRDKFYYYFITVLDIIKERNFDSTDLGNLKLLNSFKKLDLFNITIENKFYRSRIERKSTLD